MGHAHPWAVNTAAIGSGSCVQNEAQVALYAGTAQLYKEVSPHMRLLGPAVCGERSQGVESAAGVRHIKGVDLWQVWLGQALDLEQLPRQLDLALEAHEVRRGAGVNIGGQPLQALLYHSARPPLCSGFCTMGICVWQQLTLRCP
jgi:hypothetical protein